MDPGVNASIGVPKLDIAGEVWGARRVRGGQVSGVGAEDGVVSEPTVAPVVAQDDQHREAGESLGAVGVVGEPNLHHD